MPFGRRPLLEHLQNSRDLRSDFSRASLQSAVGCWMVVDDELIDCISFGVANSTTLNDTVFNNITTSLSFYHVERNSLQQQQSTCNIQNGQVSIGNTCDETYSTTNIFIQFLDWQQQSPEEVVIVSKIKGINSKKQIGINIKDRYIINEITMYEIGILCHYCGNC